jgi:hypothetical protein
VSRPTPVDRMDDRRITLTPQPHSLRLPRLRLHRAGGVHRRAHLRLATSSQYPHGGCETRGFRPRLLRRHHHQHVGAQPDTEMSRWPGGEFMERYTVMYPRGQPILPDDPVTAYVNNLHATGAAPGSTTTQRARTTRRHDPTRECNVFVVSASSSFEPEPAPHHRITDAQRWARLDELVEARRQLDEELALLHQELGMDAEPRYRRPAQDIPCRRSLVRGTATGVSAVRLPISRTTAHQHHHCTGRHVTTTDTPKKARTSTQMPTQMLRRSFDGCHRTLPLWPCCYAAARRRRPPRTDECANS